MDYALLKDDLKIGDVVISSGFDGLYPKGLRIGTISKIVKHSSGMFQDVIVTPFVDFEKLEEVLVVMKQKTNEEADSE